MVHAIVLITAEPARIAGLASDIADLVTGSIAAQPGVLRTRTLIAFRVYSQADMESI